MRKSYRFERLGRKVQRLAAIMLVTLMAVGNVFAMQVTFTFSEQGYTNGKDLVTLTADEPVAINDYVSFTAAKGSATNTPKYYNTGTAIRFYPAANGNGSSITLTPATGYKIIAVTVNENSGNTGSIGFIVDGASPYVVNPTDNACSIENVEAYTSLTFYNAEQSTSGHIRIASITVTYVEENAVVIATPTFTPPAGNCYTPQTVSLSCATPGATIYYSINGSTPFIYNAPFTISATATVSAYAQVGEYVGATATAEYVFPVAVANIAAFLAAENATLCHITGDLTFVYRHGKYIYVKDESGALLIYDNASPYVVTTYYNEGDVITGGVYGIRSPYEGYTELVPTVNPAEGNPGSAVAPIEVTVADLVANPNQYVSSLVVLRGGQLGAGTFSTSSVSNVNYTQGENTIVLRNAFKTLSGTYTAGTEATVAGFVTLYDGNVQLYPRNNKDIAVTGLPYNCAFESGAIAWILENGTAANKWYIGEPAGFSNNALYISSSNGATNKYNVTSASDVHACLPVTLPASDMLLTFDLRTVGESDDYLQVSVLDEAPTAGTLPTTYLARYYNVNEFTTQSVVIPASYAGEKYIVFTWHNDNAVGVQTPAAIDNVTLNTTCTTPTELAATVTDQTATVTWTAPEAQNAWVLEYKAANADAWQSVNATATSVTLNNLATNMDYNVRVKAVCGEESSLWANAQFNVPCQQLTTDDLEITIGTGTSTTYYAPFGPFYKNSWVQMIYPASNFETPGYINSLSWEVNAVNAQACSSLKIYIGTTTHENNLSTTDWVPMSDLTLVYDASNVAIGSSTGWETYTFSSPYYYSGEENLVVVTSRSASEYKSLYYKATGNNTNAVMYRWNDNDASYASHPGTGTASGRNGNLPNMKIDFLGYVCGDAVCAAPTALNVSNVTTNGAELAWEGDATSYVVSYKPVAADEWTTVLAPTNAYTLTGLEQNTAYTVRVKADCGTTGMSEEIAANFTTVASCIAPQNLTATAVTHTVNVNWLPVNGIDAYEVHVTGNNTDFTINVANASQTNISGLVEGATYAIAVRAICGEDMASDWSEMNFIMPTICPAPTGFAVANKGEHTATLKWNAGDASAWTVEYGYEGFTLGQGTQVNVNVDSVVLTGLNAYSTYDVYVKADCGLGYESNWSSKLTFTTECGPITITAQHPWTEGFESYTGSGNLAFDNCWATPEMSHYNSPFIYRNYATAAHTGKNSVELKGDNGEITTLVFPAFTNPLADLQFSYYGMVTGTTPGTMQLGYVTDPADASTFVELQVIPAQEGSYNRASSLEYGPFFFTGVTDPNARIALRFTSATSSCSWNLDDFMVRLLPNCIAPSNLVVSAVTNTTATMGWTENGDATAWNIEYGPAGFTQGEGTVVPANANPFTVTGLAASTTYDFYVQSNCGMGDLSEWTASASATTKCDPILVTENNPWFEDFEGYTVTGPFLCWETPVTYTASNGVFPLVYCNYSSACHSGVNSAELKGSTNVLVLPEFANNTYDLQVSFWATRTSTSNGNLEVGYLTDLEDMNSFVSLATTPGPSTRNGVGTNMGTYMFPFSTPANARIALRYTNTSTSASWNLDDFTVSLAPSCRQSSDLNFSNVMTTSANVSWTPGGLETAWTLQYKASSSDDWTTVNATSATMALTNLAPSTEYSVRVKPVCAEGTAEWLTGNFTTDCANWTPGNMDITIGTGTTTTYYAPFSTYYKNSWTQMIYPASYFDSPGTINSLSWEVNSALTHNFQSLRIYLGTTTHANNTSTTDWVPMEDLTLVYSADNGSMGGAAGWETYQLSTPYSYNANENLVVVVSRKADNYKSLYYKSTSGNTNAVMYRWNDGTASYGDHPGTSTASGRNANLPNMMINYDGLICGDEHCAAPTFVEVLDVTNVEAILTWVSDGATAWRVGYKAADATEWTSVDVTETNYTLTGLTPNTTYDVRVKTICSGDESVYETLSFKTLAEGCFYTFDLEDSYGDGWNGNAIELVFSDGTTQSLTIESGYTATFNVTIPNGVSMVCNWTTGSYPNETSFTITDEAGNEVYTGSNTQTNGFFSSYCAMITCPAPTALTATDVENGSSTITWTAGGTETSWIITLTPNEGDAITATLTEPTYTVTGMQPGDFYEVAVKADCGDGDESVEVTTTVLCPALVDIALEDVYTNPSNCDLSGAIARITVKNMLESPISTFEAYYKVNNGDAVHETVTLTTPMNEGDTYVYTFATAPVFTENANTITAWVEIPSETATENNQKTSGVTRLTEVKTVPYVDEFGSASVNNWFMIDGNGDNTTFAVTGSALQYAGSDEFAANDWAVSPCVQYSPSTMYLFSFDYKANSPYFNETFSAYVGPSADPSNNYFIETFTFNNTTYKHYDLAAYLTDNADNLHMAFKAESEVGTAGFNIDNVSIKKALNFSVSYGENGSVSDVTAFNYFNNIYYVGEGEPVTLTITPDLGYHVLAIYVNGLEVRGENTNNAAVDFFTFTPANEDDVYVTFTPNVYKVTATVNNLYYTAYLNNAPGASYSPMYEEVNHGGAHHGIITMAPYYHFETLSVNGQDYTELVTNLGNGQYALTLDPVFENKNINVVVDLDSATITYTVNGGEGTINGEFVVDANTTLPATYVVKLKGYSSLFSTIVPAPGYHVASIKIDGTEHTNIESYMFHHLLGDHTVEVVFAKNHYVITTHAYGNGTVSDDYEFDYDPNITYTFTATPAAGYRIGTITRNNVALTVTDPSATYTETLTNILDNYNYEVMFVQNTYAVAASCGNNGTISPMGTSSYLYHQSPVYVINADQGYYIASVTVDGTTTTYTQDDSLINTTYTFADIDADHTISATFAQMLFTVTVNAGPNGAISPITANYAYGAIPSFTITPDAGYSIADVTIDGNSIGAVSTYTFLPLTADHTIAATFSPVIYTITATAGNGGTISPAGNTNVAYNGTQAYTISANAGYHVSGVYVDGALVGTPTTYTFTDVTANHTIYAAFEQNEYTVTVTQPDHGTITPGTISVLNGATPAFVITPALGYSVTAITVNGTNVTLANVPNVNGTYTYTFSAIHANQTLAATMTAKTYTINASAGANGSISPAGNTTVNFGAAQAYTITPAAGYVIDSVMVDDINMGAISSYVFTNVMANHTIAATFKAAECETPSFLYTTHIDTASAILHWSHPTATTFDVQYKTPTSNFTSVPNVSGNSYQLTDLAPSTTYMWQVRAHCAGGNLSEWSNLTTFTTEAATIDNTGIEDMVKNNIKVYAEHQNVHILNNEGMNIENVRIFDAYGKMVYSGAVSTSHEVINLNVAAGAYIVNVTTDSGVANYKVTILK